MSQGRHPRHKAQPYRDQGFSYRLFQAVSRLEGGLGRRLNQEELGERVGKAMGREPYDQSSVSDWLTNGVVPPVPTVAALAQVCGVDPGWLAFGGGDEVESGLVGPTPTRRLPPADTRVGRKKA